MSQQEFAQPSLIRRLAIAGYDVLLLSGVLIMATLPVVLIYRDSIPAENPLFRLYLVTLVVLFYSWFWTHGGQTLGMKTWRVRLIRTDGKPLTWTNALVRFLAALLSWLPLGLGFAWMLFDRESLTWHDKLSKTRLVLLPED